MARAEPVLLLCADGRFCFSRSRQRSKVKWHGFRVPRSGTSEHLPLLVTAKILNVSKIEQTSVLAKRKLCLGVCMDAVAC